MTYRTKAGKQYIVIASGVADENALVAFTIDGCKFAARIRSGPAFHVSAGPFLFRREPARS